MVPNFLVIGAAKSATSWIYKCLEEHPDIFVPFKKEIRFFSDHYGKGVDWYKKWFDGYDGETAIGEVSPAYLCVPEVPKRIAHDLPNVRLICSLRNPIERAYSEYCMHLRGGATTANIDKEIIRGCYTENGLYYQQISRYLKYFPKENILILFYEDLKKNSLSFIQKILTFLKVDPEFVPSMTTKKYNVRKIQPRSLKLHNVLVQLVYQMQNTKIGSLMFKATKRLKLTNLINILNAGKDFPKLTEKTRSQLVEIFREDVENLSRLLGTEKPYHWLEY